MANLDVILDKISKLINKAEHPGTPEHEAAAFRAGAERLMREYRIEQEDLLAQDATAAEPILSVIDLCDYTATRYASWYREIMFTIARHTGTKVYTKIWHRPEGGITLQAAIVGYEGDVRYAEYLFSAARLVFVNRVDVRPDASLSDAENVFRLRSAGWNRYEIAEALWGDKGAAATTRATKLYRAECARRGVPELVAGRGINVKQFRQSFANGFYSGLNAHLRAARDAADSTGGAIQLHGREERVLEAFYTFFPILRPQPKTEVAEKETKPAKVDRRRKSWTMEDERRYQRWNSRESQAADALGRAAAAEVEVNRTSRAKRVEEATPSAPSGELTA